MALQPPSPKFDVERDEVAGEVEAMLLDRRVKWIAIEWSRMHNGVDLFIVTPWTTHPGE